MSNSRPSRSIHVSLPEEFGGVGDGGADPGVPDDGGDAGVGLGGVAPDGVVPGGVVDPPEFGCDGGTFDGAVEFGCDPSTLSSTITISIFSDTDSP